MSLCCRGFGTASCATTSELPDCHPPLHTAHAAVLDDNCTLCLPNGERVKLPPSTMRVLFEVQDLSAASPATVSRCGMVYVGTELGWRPFVASWVRS